MGLIDVEVDLAELHRKGLGHGHGETVRGTRLLRRPAHRAGCVSFTCEDGPHAIDRDADQHGPHTYSSDPHPPTATPATPGPGLAAAGVLHQLTVVGLDRFFGRNHQTQYGGHRDISTTTAQKTSTWGILIPFRSVDKTVTIKPVENEMKS